MTRTPLALALVLASACAGPRIEPKHGSPRATEDALELFRRARFAELTRQDPDALGSFAKRLRSSNVSMSEDYDDLVARAAYRRGEVEVAREAAAALSEDNKTRRLVEALLTHVDPLVPVRESRTTKRIVELPLEARALDRGYLVIPVVIDDRRYDVLWDTGATDNVLGPDAADQLELPETEVQFTLRRRDDALVVRLAATVTRELHVGAWAVRNVPWLVSELDTVEGLKRDIADVDGFLSPQLLLPNGCFAVDRRAAILRIGFGAQACAQLMADATLRTPLYTWDGELFVSARVDASPELAVRVETGSPVTFLRTHAARYLPKDLLLVRGGRATGEEIARDLGGRVSISVAGRQARVPAIELDPARPGSAHDDIATLGNDVLLQGRGLVVDFTRMELGTLDVAAVDEPGSRPR
ncbi:retroviral-like aspartic protease family protein [Myxococcota bacterium]|nr:retroviral-like aspartic protease family protein [Myxococcota bacterium]